MNNLVTQTIAVFAVGCIIGFNIKIIRTQRKLTQTEEIKKTIDYFIMILKKTLKSNYKKKSKVKFEESFLSFKNDSSNSNNRNGGFDENIIQNHLEIEMSSDTFCKKELRHFFEVTNNNGKYDIYDANIPQLLRRTRDLVKTADEELCCELLGIQHDVSRDYLLSRTKEWDTIHLEKYGISLPDHISNLVGPNQTWSKTSFIGELWLTYIECFANGTTTGKESKVSN